MRKAHLILFILCLKASIGIGQVPFFEQYYPLKRTQAVQVNTIFQDRTGFVWFGTNGGLFRFDGTEYRRYSFADSLQSDQVTALAQDSLGRLWVGRQSGHLSYVENGSIKSFNPREGSAVEPISDILFDAHGTLWFSTKSDGLYFYRQERLYRIDQQEGLPDLFVYDLFEDKYGRIWAGTDAGVAICSLVDGKVKVQVLDSDDGLTDIIVKKIKSIGGDAVGLATEDAGILSVHLESNRVESLMPEWSSGSVSDFVVKENQLWISVPRHGVVVVDRKGAGHRVLREVDGASLLSVNGLMKDQEGNIWLASKAGALRTMGDAVEHLSDLDPLRDISVMAVAVDRKGRVWFSTSEGLFVLAIDKNGTSTVTRKFLNSSFKNAPVISLFADDHDHIWAGLYGEGLMRIHTETGSIKHFRNEIRNGNILGITGTDSSVWVATLGGGSVINFADGGYTVQNYGSADGLASDFIYQVFVDSRDRSWFATDGKGVSMLDGNRFYHYSEGLPSKVVYSIAEDAYGDIWVSSQGNGALKFDGGRFVRVPELRLRDNSVQSLFADGDGHLIATHNFGIDVYDIRNKQMRYWGEESGLRDQHPNLNAVSVDRFGQFYIGTTKGIVKFSLRNDREIAVPRPAIDRVLIFGEPVNLEDKTQLSHNENNITIDYLAFWYRDARNLNYQYKLDNYDLEWISTRNQQVTYSRLPPGDYTFRVKASHTEHFEEAPETTLSFSINPPFWRTSGFYTFVFGAFVISAYAFMKFRERKLLEAKLILEVKVEERTREIQLKTEEIQAQNEEIMAQAEEIQGINENLEMLVKQRTAELEKKNKALEEYAFINAHKLRSPVASILGLVNLLAKAEPKDDTRVIREHLKKSADKLDAIVRSITKAIENADNKFS